MGDDNGVQVDVRRSFQRDSAHLAFSRDETFWQRERKTHKKPPPLPQIKCVFQGRSNSGSSPMTLCAQLSQRITWFIYSLECSNGMIELFLFYFIFPFDVHGAASGRGMTSTMECGSVHPSPQFAEKSAEAALFPTETRTDFLFLRLGKNRQEHPPTLEQT